MSNRDMKLMDACQIWRTMLCDWAQAFGIEILSATPEEAINPCNGRSKTEVRQIERAT